MRWPKLSLRVVGGLLTLSGCSANGLTEHEQQILAESVMEEVPPDPSNAWADDPNAAVLGQKFFFDPRFSGPIAIGDDGLNGGYPAGEAGHISCASCHDPAAGGVDHRSRPGSTSLAAGRTGRHTPTVYNAAFQEWLFWDGRKDSLWSQAIGPIESPVEHNYSRLEAVHLVYDKYRAEYEAIFGELPDLSDHDRFPATGLPGSPAWDAMAPEDRTTCNRIYSNIGKAIAAYERLLISRNSEFDQFMRGDTEAMSPAAVRGAKLFVGRAGCINCHSGPAFSDGGFHNIGVPQTGPFVPTEDIGRLGGIEAVRSDDFNRKGLFSDARRGEHLAAMANETPDVTRGSFRTPGLRDITLTAPYMHTGGIESLWDVLEFYRFGGAGAGYAGRQDPLIQPLELSDDDLHDLAAFLEALEGEALPIGLVTPPELPQ